MTRLITCPAGHAWEVADPHSPAAETCPECGRRADATEQLADSADDHLSDTTPLPGGDELPPLPSPLAAPNPAVARRGPAEMPMPMPKIEGHEILGVIGRGGMGVVYRARQLRLNRLVALKLLRAGHVARQDEIDRFRLEAEAAARFQHPNIVQIFDVGEHEGNLFCILEFVEGGTLAEKIGGKPLPPREAAEIAAILARAIDAAHKRGILHRDLKPANVLLTEDGRPKIADFGLAKRLDDDTGPTMSGVILGTPAYMAPEQAQGRTKEIGRASDLYSLGAILYEMLTGRPPFRAATALEMLRLVVSEPPIAPDAVRPEVPPELSRICLKCLSKSPADRYADGGQLAQALQAFLAGPEPLRSAAEPEPRSNRWGWRELGILLLVVVILIGIANAPYWLGWNRPVAQPGDKPEGESPPAKPKLPDTPVSPEVKLPLKEVKRPVAPPHVEPDPQRRHWTILAAPPGSEKGFERISFVSESVGYLASQQKLYKTEDGGKSWTALPGEAPGKVYAMQFTDKSTGWLGNSRLLHTTDGGESWQPIDLAGMELKQVRAIAAKEREFRLVGGLNAASELELFVQRGATGPWERIDPKAAGLWGGADEPFRHWYLADIAVVSSKEAVVALLQKDLEEGIVLRTADGGVTWKAVPNADAVAIRLGAGGGRVWAMGNEGYLGESLDAGQNWDVLKKPLPGAAGVAALAVAPNGRFALAPLRDGTVLVFTDGRWEPLTDVGLERLRDAIALDSGFGLVLGDDGRMAKFGGK